MQIQKKIDEQKMVVQKYQDMDDSISWVYSYHILTTQRFEW